MLVSIVFVTVAGQADGTESDPPLKFASQTTRFGHAYVDSTAVPDWKSRKQDGEDLLDKCEDLYEKCLSDRIVDVQES